MRSTAPTSRPWQLVTLSALGLALGCTSPGTDPGTTDDGALHGEIVGYLVDYADHSETQHLLRLPGGEERKLILDGEQELTPGMRVRLWGSDQGDAIKVVRLE